MILERYPHTNAALPNSVRLLSVTASLPPENATLAGALPDFSAALMAIDHGQTPQATDVAVVDRASPNDLGPLLVVAHKLIPAQQAAPNQWQWWWRVCIAGQIVFVVLVFTMRGRWSPRAAKRDLEEHEREVERALNKLRSDPASDLADHSSHVSAS